MTIQSVPPSTVYNAEKDLLWLAGKMCIAEKICKILQRMPNKCVFRILVQISAKYYSMTLCTIKLNNGKYIVIVRQQRSWKCFIITSI